MTSTNQEMDLFHSLLPGVVISRVGENANIDYKSAGSQNDAGFPKLSIVVESKVMSSWVSGR